jgi:hypothetical protein
MLKQVFILADPIERSDTMRNILRLKNIILSIILSIALLPTVALAADDSEGRKPSVSSQSVKTQWKRVRITMTPTNDYWEKLASCQSKNKNGNPRWKKKGSHAGGLSIYTHGSFGDHKMGAWEKWGGEEFAPSPDQATKQEQIIVANRIAVLGWQTTYTKDNISYTHRAKPIGFKYWSCARSFVGQPRNYNKNVFVSLPTNPKMYCPQYESLFKKFGLPVKLFSYIAWRESRCEPKAVGWNYHAGMNHLSCKEVTPSCKAVKSFDSGLLQINSTWRTLTSQVCSSQLGDLSILKDPICNVKVAKYLYENTTGRLSNWNITVYVP